jgi:hypothetical protein
LVRVHVVIVIGLAAAWDWQWRAGLRLGRLLLVLAALGLTSCAADPRNEADAERIRVLAVEEAADRQELRRQEQARFALDLEELERGYAARGSARIFAVQMIVIASGLAGSLVLVGVAVGVVLAAVGAGRAAAEGAMLRARVIGLDRATRLYPVILHYAGRGRFTLANPNTGEVIGLDTRMAADREQLRSAGQVQLAGVIAEVHHETLRS